MIVKAIVAPPQVMENKLFPLFTTASIGMRIDNPLHRMRKPPHQGMVGAILYKNDKGAVRITEL